MQDILKQSPEEIRRIKILITILQKSLLIHEETQSKLVP